MGRRLEAQVGEGRGCTGRGKVDATSVFSLLSSVFPRRGCRGRGKVAATGCYWSPECCWRDAETTRKLLLSPVRSFPGISIKVGALGDMAILAGVSPQRGEWQASRKGDVAIRDEPLTLESLSSIDVVLFPAQRLGDLVDAGVLAPIPNAAVLPPKPPEDETENQDRRERDLAKAALDDTFQYMDIARAFREHVSKYGPERVALPCGGSALVLVYRRDAFESVPNREAARQAGLSLEQPPTTWPQLDALAQFFQGRDWNGDGTPDHGIALALGADTEGVGDATFLARAASLGLHRDHYSFLFDADDDDSANRHALRLSRPCGVWLP